MTLFGLAVSIIFGLAALGGGDISPGPEPQPPIRLLSIAHEVDFPDEIEFTLELEGNEIITEVTLFYRLGRQDVRIFGYPDFTPGKRVTATFGVKTGGAHFIPSGVDISYYYRIRDITGHTYETDTFHLEYLDSRYDWQRYQEGDLILLWHDRPRAGVVRVASDVSQRLVAVRELLGLEETKPMKAVIVNSSGEAGRNFPRISEASSRGHLYGGFAFGDLDVFVLAGLDRDGIVHEMTHLLIDEAVDSPLAKMPSWLNEGLAMYFESGSRGREATVSQAASRGGLRPLRTMGNQPGRPREVRVFYAQAWSTVNYMMETYGEERMAALLTALEDGGGIEKAIPSAYGMSLDELEQEWLGQITGGSSVATPSDPGSVGTSVIITGAVAVAAVAVIIRWLRRITSASNGGGTLE